jgi:hypothetical protein
VIEQQVSTPASIESFPEAAPEKSVEDQSQQAHGVPAVGRYSSSGVEPAHP